ncbi:MAG: Anaerobic ribonucleoside-triphosphate reductase activating protein [Thermotoga sp. 50_1627]|uniref:anaerobic ribonucleoside-triphosphate reductase activating protein n=1 Tax=Pseudothermotoga sp. TaxID=2033661 RepID=UPI00076D52FA|nr:MAG: Anaerobic ribonucleoside-triphosphate reductase activating protein [Thermotoga sp. 50_64]KUK25591.1 MAG: Anaerobic ribonucleoside-triphosphate reductase activating protein [Thermotoga sp. 50_1627]MBC7116616.1 anaerobic ribonucleoside-triphosphate reductase activating protein [Pseudothermotoga sp.]MDK2922627.1 pyruvate formate lyase activating enzyme [Pseudothermotoga sp.]
MKFARTVLTSLLDYPKSISIVLFTVGCNFRCPYCHNPELVLAKVSIAEEEEIFGEIRKRNITNRVVITGGEPTVHDDLLKFVRRLKRNNYLVKLDTNGSNPRMVEDLLANGLLDYVALDIKSGIEKFPTVTGLSEESAKEMFKNVLETLRLLKRYSVPHEVRTTYVPGLLDERDIAEIKELVGDSTWYLQRFRPQKTLRPFTNVMNSNYEDLSKLASKFGAKAR